MKREIIIDTETTGGCPYYGHRIIEIGAIEVVDQVKTSRVFHSYLNPERSISPGAQSVHRIPGSFLRNKPKFKEVAQAFLDFIGDAPLVIHNARFDMKFINAELAMADFQTLDMKRTIDTVWMARRKFPGMPASLDALCKRFGVCTKRRVDEGHGALLDAELLFEVYINLMRQPAFPKSNFLYRSSKVSCVEAPKNNIKTADETKKFIEIFRNKIWKDL
jgi:DNA polymerase-3 subunit epsilon